MGTPLTEEKFNEFLKVFETRMSGVENRMTGLETRMTGVENRMTGLETRMSGLETRMSGIEGIVKELKGFQDYEAKAIEYELKKTLQAHLKKKFPLYTVETFGMKRLYDQYDKEITELDAAFLIKPWEYVHDYSILASLHKNVKIKKNKLVYDENYTFVFAEAKHHISLDKVKYKLQQFHQICQLFTLARNVLEKKIDKDACSPKFIKTVERNSYLGKIDNQYLYFCAAYWNDGLLDKLQEVISEYKSLSSEFPKANNERKVAIYRKICKLESEWYAIHPAIPNTEIESLTSIDSIYNYVDFIVPSGHRFHAAADSVVNTEPEGFAAWMRGGVRKTRKHATQTQ